MKISGSVLLSLTAALSATFILTACHSGAMIPPSQTAPLGNGATAAARPKGAPCDSGLHVDPAYAQIDARQTVQISLIYTEDYYRCPTHGVRANWTKSGPGHGHLQCRRSCVTTTFWANRPGTYSVIPKGTSLSATVVVTR